MEINKNDIPKGKFSIFGKISEFFQKNRSFSSAKVVSENAIFKSVDVLNTLKEDGVVKISFLDENAINTIQAIYKEVHPEGQPKSFFEGIHMTIWDENERYKTMIRKKLEEVLNPFFDLHFTNYRALSQQFIVKLPGSETTFPVHQDWSIVNEMDYFSLNIWIPLQDVDSTNGAMWIVKGSHRLQQPIRGAGSLFPNYYPLLEEMKPYMTSFPMKAGEALIFYHSTIHGSPQNLSNEPRLTVQVSILPQEAPMEIYFQPIGSTSIEVHHPDDNFNFKYANIREESVTKAPTESCSRIITNYKLKKVSIESIRNIQKLN